MIIAKLFIPGRFEDAYIYMGRLILVTGNLTLRHYNLNEVIERLELKNSRNIPAARSLFARNDWLSTEQFRLQMRNPDIADAYVRAIRGLGEMIELDDLLSVEGEQEINLRMDALLDLTIYRRRVYLAADTGLFDMEIGWEENRLPISQRRKRFDAPCYNLSASYGTANASFGEAGLYSFYDDFNTLDWSAVNVQNRGAERTADVSLRSGWFGEDLINYTGRIDGAILHGDTRELDRPSAGERKVVTGLSANHSDMDFLFQGLKTKYNLERREVDFVWNSTATLYVQTKTNHFYSAGVQTGDDGERRVRFSKEYSGGIGRILAATMVRVGKNPALVAEAYDKVGILVGNKWQIVTEGQALTVRTFPGSKRYKNLIAITLNDGVMLASVFDEESY